MEDEWRKLKPRVGQVMSHILQTGLYTDLTFTVGIAKHKVNVHKVILMARSEVFAVMLQDRWDRNKEDRDRNIIHIPDVSHHSFHDFLEYLYTDAFDERIDIVSALEVLHLAHLYQVPGLISKCSEFLNSKISVENCVDIFQGTRLYEDRGVKLSQVALNFLTMNIDKILQKEQFLHLDEEGLKELLQSDNKLNVNETALFKAVLSWSKAENAGFSIPGTIPGTSRENSLKLLIPLIRFPLMGAKDFAETVVPTKLLSETEALQMFLYFNGVGPKPDRFLAQPRIFMPNAPSIPIPIVHKFLKFKAQIENCHPRDVGLKFGALRNSSLQGMPCPYFRLNCDKSIRLHGLRFCGPALVSGPCKSLEYDLKYTISDDLFTVLAEKASKVVVSTAVGEFSLLLDEPLIAEPNISYWINLSFELKVLPMKMPPVGYVPLGSADHVMISYGTISHSNAGLRFNVDGMNFQILMCPDNLREINIPERQIRQHMEYDSGYQSSVNQMQQHQAPHGRLLTHLRKQQIRQRIELSNSVSHSSIIESVIYTTIA